MRVRTILVGQAMCWAIVTATLASWAQPSGLAPPPPLTPAPGQAQRPQPSPTQAELDRSQELDSGRGLEFIYFQVDGGIEIASLTALSQSGTLLPTSSKTSGVGGFFGVGTGVRLLYFTAGPSFRFAHHGDWDLWTLGLDVGWRVPLGKVEPYGVLSGGYAKLGSAQGNVISSDRGVSVSGFALRIGGGVDYYVTSVLSVGGNLDLAMVRLSRSAVALRQGDPSAASSLATDASSLGIALTPAIRIGLHF